MKKMFKFFLDPISAQEAWLNKMSSLGYRLVGVSKWMYSFENAILMNINIKWIM